MDKSQELAEFKTLIHRRFAILNTLITSGQARIDLVQLQQKWASRANLITTIDDEIYSFETQTERLKIATGRYVPNWPISYDETVRRRILNNPDLSIAAPLFAGAVIIGGLWYLTSRRR